MAEVRRGRCGACGCWYAVTSRGVVRKHDSSTPLAREAAYGRGGWGVCAGGGLPPIDVDAPLLTVRVAELEQEVARLRHVAEAHRLDAQAQRHRVDSLRHIRDANRHLLDALRSMMDVDHFAEQDARFERDMQAIRAQHPILDELEQR